MAFPFPWAGHSPEFEGAPKHGSPTEEPAPGVRQRRSAFERTTFGLALFSAGSALLGSLQLAWLGGGPYVPLTLLANTPFSTFFIPAVLLGGVVGGTSLASAILSRRRSPASPDATMLAGGALFVWIAAELAMMRTVHFLHLVYGALGLALLALGIVAAWRSNEPRHRWVVATTAAEAAGFLVPATAGVLSAKFSMAATSSAVLLIGAGFVEGLALGAGQAWAFPLPIRRARYAGLTALGTSLVWSSVMLTGVIHEAWRASPAASVALRVASGVVGLVGIGGAQWIELCRHTRRALRWIPWTASAWLLALPLSFAPAPFVDESTPLGHNLVLWSCGGLVMAYVMAVVTWQGVRSVARPDTPTRG